MREHLYKAKRLDGQWVKGYYFAKPILNLHFIILGENQWMIDPNTLCEFTGIYDKNKNMIWENDIILTQFYSDRPYSEKKKEKRLKGIVEYKLYKFSGNSNYDEQIYKAEWKLKFLENEETLTKYRYSCFSEFWDCEVIGNIFDNPELLEVNNV